jgi:hypothetical protein
LSDDSLKDPAIREAYSNLAAAIIKSGEDANDKIFLKSNWCEALRYMVQLRTGTGGRLVGNQLLKKIRMYDFTQES